MSARRSNTVLCGFYFLFYGFYGVTIPYLPVWLASRGLDPAFVGVVIAAAFLPKVISAPFFAYIADSWGRHRVLIQVLLFTTLFSLSLFFYAHTDAWFFSLTMAVNFFAPAILPLMDRAAIAQRTTKGASSYTAIRLWGSLGFAVFSLLCGALIDYTGADGVIWFGAFLTVTCMVLTRIMPADRPITRAIRRDAAASKSAASISAPRSPLLQILRDPSVLCCIGASALVHASNGYLYSYASLYWLNQGLDTSQIGLLWTVGIAAEVALFMVARHVLVLISPTRLIALAAIMTAIRWLGLAWYADFGAVVMFQLLQAFTLAGNNMAIMAYLAQRVGDQSRTTAISIYTMLSAGLFMFLVINLVNAMGVAQNGGGFAFMAVCSILALPLMWWASRLEVKPVTR